MSRKRAIAPGEYYHVFNRAAHKREIFKEKNDWARFLFNILYLQSPHLFKNVSRLTGTFTPTLGFDVAIPDIEEVLKKRVVELVVFALMPNHFHLLVKEREEGGMADYMQRVLISYTKYFNAKYEASGHVFQGPYKTVHVKSDTQLLYLSTYIHRNPRELAEWRAREFEYPWSSLQDFTEANRWGGLIMPEIITGQFDGTEKSNYADFVKTSPAKTLQEELEGVMLS